MKAVARGNQKVQSNLEGRPRNWELLRNNESLSGEVFGREGEISGDNNLGAELVKLV